MTRRQKERPERRKKREERQRRESVGELGDVTRLLRARLEKAKERGQVELHLDLELVEVLLTVAEAAHSVMERDT